MARKKKEVLPPEHCASVREYERSNWWIKKSKALLDDKELICPICKRKRWTWMPRAKKWRKIRYVSHHTTYENCPHEKPEDIMLVCWQCHDLFHLLLRLEAWGGVFKQLADIARTVFSYKGFNTFKGW